jgi:hypothetical protein
MPNSMEDHCEEYMTFAGTYEIQDETKCNHDDVNFYQASKTVYCTAEAEKNNSTEIPPTNASGIMPNLLLVCNFS